MARVMVLGSPGSGKSTLATQIAARTGAPAFHLDRLFHQAGWVPRPPADFHADVATIAALPAWVIDGNYPQVAAPRLAAADMVVYLDLPRRLCVTRILRRILSTVGRQRPDAAEGCVERLDPSFLRYVWRWERDVAPSVRAILTRFGGAVIVVRSEADIRTLLESFGSRRTDG